MTKKPFVYLIAVFSTFLWAYANHTLTNDLYSIEVNPEGVAKVSLKESPSVWQTLSPDFVVMYTTVTPKLEANHKNYMLAPRSSILWGNFEEDLDTLNGYLASADVIDMCGGLQGKVTQDSKGKRVWKYFDKTDKLKYTLNDPRYSRGTTNPFAAGNKILFKGAFDKIKDNILYWKFSENEILDLSAKITLPKGSCGPEIEYSINVKKRGYFSVAYMGVEKIDKKLLNYVPQDATGGGYRQFNHLVPESVMKLQRIQVATDKFNMALIVDKNETPFRVPTRSNSRYGLMMALENSKIFPVVMSPILGGEESKMEADSTYKFKIQYLLSGDSDWISTYKKIATEYYGLRDMRDNSGPGSLNQALEASMDFLSNIDGNNYAMWHNEQKYYDYWNDKTNVFKPFSLLYGLSAAVITDDLEFFKSRVYPHTEYTLSRMHNIFSPYDAEENSMISNPQRAVGGAWPNAAELYGIASFYKMRNPYIINQIEKKGFNENDYYDVLTKYFMTNDPAVLAQLQTTIKNRYLKGQDINYRNSPVLLDIYQQTHDAEVLKASHKAVYGLADFINVSPYVPDEIMVADEGGKAHIHIHSWGRHLRWGYPPPVGLPVPEQKVPAWRIALTGLETAGYRGDYWLHHYGHIMRLASMTNDDFLRTIARWAMVGRYGMFPGDNRSDYSLVAELRDVTNREPWEWSYATVNPGHAWEFVGEILDFMISDAFDRSNQQIDFPHRVMTLDSFRVRTYGDRPGKFYDKTNVNLWMPKALLKIDNKQLDWVSGYSGDNFYIVFINQSFKEENFEVEFNKDKIICSTSANRLDKGFEGKTYNVENNKIRLTAKPKSLVAIEIPNCKLKLALHALMNDKAAPQLGKESFIESQETFGKVIGYMLSMGKDLTYAHLYTTVLPEDTIKVSAKYRFDNDNWQSINEDVIYPYEFTVQIPDSAKTLEFKFKHQDKFGNFSESKILKLVK